MDIGMNVYIKENLDGCFNECSMNKCVDVGMIALISIEINE
jgi:hypothetical protein